MAQSLLVTGANGFVGRALCTKLIACGYAVRAGIRDATRANGVAGEVITVGTVGPHTDWSAAVSGVDSVVHLAARVHVMKETAADPLSAYRAVNVEATQALAQAAARHGVKRFVYVSSIKVNGEGTSDKPFSPLDAPHPQDPYGISKWEAEQRLWRIAKNTGLEVVIVRPPLVYGAGVGGNLRRLLSVIARGVPLPLASVRNRRSMVYNGNLASALIACATHSAAAGKTYLVSDGEDLTTPDLMRRLGEMIGRPARLLHCPLSLLQLAACVAGKGEEVSRLTGSLEVDSSHLCSDLGWAPPFTVDEGLSETARWFVSDGRRAHGASFAR